MPCGDWGAGGAKLPIKGIAAIADAEAMDPAMPIAEAGEVNKAPMAAAIEGVDPGVIAPNEEASEGAGTGAPPDGMPPAPGAMDADNMAIAAENISCTGPDIIAPEPSALVIHGGIEGAAPALAGKPTGGVPDGMEALVSAAPSRFKGLIPEFEPTPSEAETLIFHPKGRTSLDRTFSETISEQHPRPRYRREGPHSSGLGDTLR